MTLCVGILARPKNARKRMTAVLKTPSPDSAVLDAPSAEPSPSLPFVVEAVPGKGLGCVALRYIALGERRAKAVARYLEGLGVNASQIETVSYGEEKPLDNSRTEAGFAKNRRAVLVY